MKLRVIRNSDSQVVHEARVYDNRQRLALNLDFTETYTVEVERQDGVTTTEPLDLTADTLAVDFSGGVIRTGTVFRDGSAVAGADVVFITRADLLSNATAQTTTDASGAYSAEIPTGEEMVGIALEGADGDSTPFTEGA